MRRRYFVTRFLSRSIPPFERVLLVESGARDLFEKLLPRIYEEHGDAIAVDLVTCYVGVPDGFRENQGAVYRVWDHPGGAGAKQLLRALRAKHYSILGIICSGEPIMTKWKWLLAAGIPAKVFILNENGDYFWLDRSNWRVVVHFIAYRTGLSGAGAVRTIARLLLFPFGVLYLILFAAVYHLRRRVYIGRTQP